MFERTPHAIIEEVKKLAKELTKDPRPEYLEVEIKPHSIQLDCYNNVDRQIKEEGGKVQYGWQVWEWPGVMIEAEFHAVWRDKEGKLHDITPKPVERIKRILFVPDSTRTYEGRQIDNVRMPLHDDPLIQEFIDMTHEYFLEMNSGMLADFHGYVELTPKMRALLTRRDQLVGILSAKYPLGRKFVKTDDLLAPGGIAPRLECSPSLAFGLRTASRYFSVEKYRSGGSIPLKDNQTKGYPSPTINLLGGEGYPFVCGSPNT